jgi:hypothetical protein
MKTITKSLVGTIAAGAVAMASVSPALAQGDRNRDRDHGDHRGGISTGEVIAGALILGGIAAVAASSDNHRDGRYDRDGRGRYDDRYGNPRSAVEQCVQTAERRAARASWGSRADVTDIRSIRDTRYGYTVKGRIAVNTRGHDWRNNDPRYGRGWGNDYRGWNDNLRGYDAGNFTCKVNWDGRTSVSFSGIRGLR